VTAVSLLSQFKALGVSLAIDDFGTGYSSLSYLHRFPLDTLKIDRSFTDAMGSNPKQASMISRTILPLANHLGLDVVAEGVETIEEAAMLKELRRKYAQGFLYSRLVRAEQVLTMLAQSVEACRSLRATSRSPSRERRRRRADAEPGEDALTRRCAGP
jgi:EAL domain-containing protein (putative c-di-GMP-specific phosphodiesterase class I)